MGASAKSIWLLCMFFLLSSHAYAAENITTDTYFTRAGMKIVSGVTNVATGWMELPKNINLWSQRESRELVALTEGILRGIVHTASRTGSGVLDVATFWLPTFPTPTPLFIWEDFSQESKYYAFRTGA
ncbi:MAG: exosortase system-associated protein, TIGR04073 family [Burkholderiales bacterium]|nr:exosortase system-associated protein, TIGR04073 family [Burkholderiales bacterium]MDR4517236.1 exosortase system-associated protein, TIGR04073 family [Nitrosomonas sp.]